MDCDGYPPTPAGSDMDQLEYYERVADWLYVGNCTGSRSGSGGATTGGRC